MLPIKIATIIIEAFENGNKVLACGNGGSAAEASHLVAEFLCKVRRPRAPLPAISLNDVAVITAIGNDYGFEHIFSRQVLALGNRGDVLVALSTSGNSKNVLKAISAAKSLGLKVIDWPRNGSNTPDIQENQLKDIHEVCLLVEDYFLEK